MTWLSCSYITADPKTDADAKTDVDAKADADADPTAVGPAHDAKARRDAFQSKKSISESEVDFCLTELFHESHPEEVSPEVVEEIQAHGKGKNKNKKQQVWYSHVERRFLWQTYWVPLKKLVSIGNLARKICLSLGCP